MLGTPTGRKRYGQMLARRSSSPSPLKPRTVSGDLASRASNMMLGDPMDVDEEDDEETLQLKLEEIQAQLRLKKLRKEKARAAGAPQGSFTSQTSDGDNDRNTRPGSASMAPPAHRIKEIRRTDPATTRPRSQPPAPVEVPASPVRKVQPPPSQTSPSRILLGIDKGLTGKDISLKRAPSLRKSSDDTAGSHGGGYLRTSRSFDEKQKPPSFSERLKAAREEETAREEKRTRAARSRSTAFNVGRQEMEDYKTNATDIMDEPSPMEREYTREEILRKAPVDMSKAGPLKRSNTISNARASPFPGASRSGQESPDTSQPQDSFTSTASEPHQPSSSPSFEPYSCFHLNKRILPHQVVARAISGKTAYSIKDLLRQVKAPDWSLPDDVIDSVVFAVVASKSDPRHHKPQYDAETGKMKQSDRGKYMVITLVDLEYEIDLFLFNTGFERFWKLSTGTVVAILNPDIMPPPPGKADTGRFSLTINSDADTILEIGVARDLGYCKSVKADGKLCSSWVNARRTEHCEFHTNTALARVRGARNELNSGTGFGKEGVDYKRSKQSRYQSREQKEAAERREKVAESHGKLDWETRSRYFVSRGGNMNQEAEEFAETRERAEGLKRRLLAKEKERDIAKRLGEMGGGGMGGEYMRLTSTTEPSTSRASTTTATRTSRFGNGRPNRTTAMAPPTAARFSPVVPRIPLPGTHHHQQDDPERKTDAASLGLLAPRGFDANNISLSPIKRKRQDSSNSNSFDGAYAPLQGRKTTTTTASTSSRGAGASNGASSSSSRTYGWGTTLKDKLGRMRDGEKLNLNLNQLKLGLHAKKDSTSSGSTATTTTSALRDKDRSPVRKKTRFVTDKGIREAGRESLPPQGDRHVRSRREVVLDDEDEDMEELVVVR
ncbi:hypothetical protein N0V82_008163 [Gnomoniopsis sp. IMI 355080]|nr:hypothetical protein N0V82_008163 [Gnomoniopsis sp. IMI 355080]